MDEQTRKALELAREALFSPSSSTFFKAIDAIDAALSAPAAPVAQCTNGDRWNCKYCRKTAACEAIKDHRNFGEPAPATPGPKQRHPERSVAEMQEFTELEDATGGVFAAGAIAPAPAAPVEQTVGRMSRATMVLGSGAGYKEVAFRFADLEDAEQVRLWAETCGAKVAAAPAAPVAQPLTDEQKRDIVTGWFAEDWAIEKALGMLNDYDRANGIGQGGA